jgi:hypothetical protein
MEFIFHNLYFTFWFAVRRNETAEAVSVVSFSQVLLGYINGIQLAKFGLLIDRTSPIYMKVRQQKQLPQFHFLHLPL